MEKKTTIENQINSILSEWNPLGVPYFIASDEYRNYIPEIIKRINDINSLRIYIYHMLYDVMEINNQYIKENKEKIDNICRKLSEI